MPKPNWILNSSEMARIKRQIKVENDCWVWQGQQTPNGYGKHRVGPGKRERVIHRILWEHYKNQKVPENLQLDHLCRNRLCCNPDHFEAVTGSENTKRQDHANRKKDKCPKGHEYNEENTRNTSSGRRVCRQCDRDRQKRATKLTVTHPASLENVASAVEMELPPR